ncbi:uncharacterized protein isoform X2 [Choristoneura fumiferana]
MINDESILRVLFGNVTEMRDLHLPSWDDISSTEESSLEEENYELHVKEYLKDTNMKSYGQDDDVNLTLYYHDLTDFNTISKSINDIDIVKQENPVILRRWNLGDKDPDDPKNLEPFKKNLLIKLMLTMVIHIRFKVDMAIRQRQLGRGSKGYRLGYLFSRLRNVKFNMAKILNSLIQRDYERHNFKWSYKSIVDNHQDDALRWYEMMFRLDAESRGLIDLIYEVIHEVNPSTTTDSDI